MDWFTSDFHYGHTNICGPKISKWGGGYRDFDSLYEMNQAIIESINSNVDKNDTLYFLGDWAFGGENNIEKLREQLFVKNIVFIFGNHDRKIRQRYRHLFSETHDLLHRSFNDQLFVMCHYPIDEWQDCHKGSIHLFGHVHKPNYNRGKRMDVGWCTHRRPLSLEEILKDLNQKDVTPHH